MIRFYTISSRCDSLDLYAKLLWLVHSLSSVKKPLDEYSL
jgi:hypothetical protein